MTVLPQCCQCAFVVADTFLTTWVKTQSVHGPTATVDLFLARLPMPLPPRVMSLLEPLCVHTQIPIRFSRPYTLFCIVWGFPPQNLLKSLLMALGTSSLLLLRAVLAKTHQQEKEN